VGVFVAPDLGILARCAMTVYYVPHVALGAELSTNFDERTNIVSYRQFFAPLAACWR
jgi:Na+/melibiose symporter-like transporter